MAPPEKRLWIRTAPPPQRQIRPEAASAFLKIDEGIPQESVLHDGFRQMVETRSARAIHRRSQHHIVAVPNVISLEADVIANVCPGENTRRGTIARVIGRS